MSLDYSENALVRDNIGNLLQDDLAGKALVAESIQSSVAKADLREKFVR